MSLKPKTVRMYSPDWDGESHTSSVARQYWVDIELGSDGQEGAFRFQLRVCNAAWVNEQLKLGVVYERALLITENFDMAAIRSEVDGIISALGQTFESWEHFVSRVSPYLIWEFEGIEYPPEV